jgi:hypothetical protein
MMTIFIVIIIVLLTTHFIFCCFRSHYVYWWVIDTVIWMYIKKFSLLLKIENNCLYVATNTICTKGYYWNVFTKDNLQISTKECLSEKPFIELQFLTTVLQRNIFYKKFNTASEIILFMHNEMHLI